MGGELSRECPNLLSRPIEMDWSAAYRPRNLRLLFHREQYGRDLHLMEWRLPSQTMASLRFP